jgi:hypothetical protein
LRLHGYAEGAGGIVAPIEVLSAEVALAMQ